MAPCNSLPAEILSKIFQYIESKVHLGECRLVSRSWDYHAESAMFGKEITLDTSYKMIQLYDHIKHKPAKGKLIKHLSLDFAFHDIYGLSLADFFEICITPNLTVLEGALLSDGDTCYRLINNIVLSSRGSFSKLKYLANTRLVTEEYLFTLSLFKKSLERVDLRFGYSGFLGFDSNHLLPDFALELDAFEKLEHLDLEMHYDECLPDINLLLDHCPHLRHVRVSISLYNDEPSAGYVDLDRIKQIRNLETLVLQADPGEALVLLQFCLAKFPDVQKIIYESPDGPPEFVQAMEEFPPELELLKNMPYFEMEFTLYPATKIQDVHKALKTDKNEVVVDIQEQMFTGQLREVRVKVMLK